VPVPVLQRQGHRFSERNTYVDAVLGMVAAGRRLDELVRAAADSAPPAASEREDSAPVPPQTPVGSIGRGDNDQAAGAVLLDFVLGLVSVSRTVRGHTEGWAAASAAPAFEAPRSSPVRTPGLLR